MDHHDEDLRPSGRVAIAVAIVAWLFILLVWLIGAAFGSADDPVALVYMTVTILGPVAAIVGVRVGRVAAAAWCYAGLVVVSVLVGSAIG